VDPASGAARTNRPLWLVLGVLFVALAALGVVLPLLPTTPFVLLASWCFARSSPRLQKWLRRSPLFGPLLRDWERDHGVRLHIKISAVAIVVLVVGASLLLGDIPAWARVVLVVLAAIGIAVVLRLRTVDPGPRGS
jgi:uncharacterized membrane protein YbaN (DUF454 family)